MSSGTVDVKLRPIKLAFLVNVNDKKALLEAIEINTFLWGGQFNPIIPVFKRIPKIWGERWIGTSNSKKIIEGYLDAYDPDYIVTVGECSAKGFNVGSRETISSSEIFANINYNGTPSYGTGLFEIIPYFINKELKFVRRKPLQVKLPVFKKPYNIFLSSVFGSLPHNINKIFNNDFGAVLNAENPACSILDYAELLSSNNLFLRRFSSLNLTVSPGRNWRPGPCIFYLDALSQLDIIDYWNLRAIGWGVLPVAKQSAQNSSTKKIALDFINENFFKDRDNPSIYHDTVILKGRSLTKDEPKEFIKSLNISPSSEENRSKYVFQHWYPRIWDEWARDTDSVKCCELEGGSAQHDLIGDGEDIRIKTLDPKFSNKWSGHGKPRFANEIKFHLYKNNKILAEVIPEGDQNLVGSIGGFGFREYRFSKTGIVYLAPDTNRRIYLSTPEAENVFSEWLKSKGWKIEISSPGHIAKQMLKKLGSIWGISSLANEILVKLLAEEMSGGKTINESSFRGKISQIANGEKYIKDPNVIMRRMIDTQMVRLGLEIQCPFCMQHSWYSIKDADYELQCQKCGDRFVTPSHSAKDIKWAYKTFGPFSLPNKAYGVYSVLLTLRFFSQLLHGSTTPIMSFNAEKDGKKLEADLGLLFQESMFRNDNTEYIFAECKTNNEFKNNDIKKMRYFAKEFPGAILVFATFNKTLTKNEKKLLVPFVNRGRRYWKAERPFNPVLILTGIELFSDSKPPYCWKDAGGKYALFAGGHHHFNDLLVLCDATQQLHLDMKPWSQWRQEQWEKRRQRKATSKNLLVDNHTETQY